MPDPIANCMHVPSPLQVFCLQPLQKLAIQRVSQLRTEHIKISLKYVLYYLFHTLQYNDANIQLLDLPGIIEGASQGRAVW